MIVRNPPRMVMLQQQHESPTALKYIVHPWKQPKPVWMGSVQTALGGPELGPVTSKDPFQLELLWDSVNMGALNPCCWSTVKHAAVTTRNWYLTLCGTSKMRSEAALFSLMSCDNPACPSYSWAIQPRIQHTPGDILTFRYTNSPAHQPALLFAWRHIKNTPFHLF